MLCYFKHLMRNTIWIKSGRLVFWKIYFNLIVIVGYVIYIRKARSLLEKYEWGLQFSLIK